jgi:hypothetical protein
MKTVDKLERKGDKQGKKEQELTGHRQIPKSFPKRCVHNSSAVKAQKVQDRAVRLYYSLAIKFLS